MSSSRVQITCTGAPIFIDVSTASCTKSVRPRRPSPHPKKVGCTDTLSIGRPVICAAALCVPCGLCVGAQTSHLSGCTWAVQFIGSIVAWARNGTS